MRIAFCGTHRSGKSTLLEHVAEQLPDHATVDEPYHLLEEDGHQASDPPTVEDFELQLERSVDCLSDRARKVLFDRCPADILAYLATHENTEAFDLDPVRERVIEAMKTLDLIIFVPVESPDRIAVQSHEDAEQRLAVHERLEAFLMDDELGCEVEVLRVEGNLGSRVEQVLTRVAKGKARRRR